MTPTRRALSALLVIALVAAIAQGATPWILLIAPVQLAWAWVGMRVHHDMESRGHDGYAYGWLVMLGGPIGLLLWRRKRADHPPQTP